MILSYLQTTRCQQQHKKSSEEKKSTVSGKPNFFGSWGHNLVGSVITMILIDIKHDCG